MSIDKGYTQHLLPLMTLAVIFVEQAGFTQMVTRVFLESPLK